MSEYGNLRSAVSVAQEFLDGYDAKKHLDTEAWSVFALHRKRPGPIEYAELVGYATGCIRHLLQAIDPEYIAYLETDAGR